MSRTRVSTPGSIRSTAISRDRSVCQCCYRATANPEVHHIKPVYLGGTNDLNNLIVLCHTCHRYAPNQEEEFLNYQKDGGAGFTLILKDFLKLQAMIFPDMTMKEIQESIIEYRFEVFEKSWDHNESIYLEMVQKIDRIQAPKEQRAILLSAIRENIKDWTSREALFSMNLPYLNESRLKYLVDAGLILKTKKMVNSRSYVYFKPAD